MGLLGDILGFGLGSSNAAYNAWANQRDFDYQKELQQQIFQREDTAAQRRMQDLIKAGINPNLAASGSGAGAGAVVSRSNTNDVNFGSGLDAMAAVQQIRAARVQNDKAKADAQLKETEAAEKTYTTLRHMGIDVLPYYEKGHIRLYVGNGMQKIETTPNHLNFYEQQQKDQERQFERNEEQFQSNMNLALSKINLTTSQINQITNNIKLSNAEFQQRVNEFSLEYGFKITQETFNEALRTYEELRKQMETSADFVEQKYRIEHMLFEEAHMTVEERQTWTNILLNTFVKEKSNNQQKGINLLSLIFSLFR